MANKLLILIFKIFTLPFWYIQKYLPRKKEIWLFGAGAGMLYFDNAKWLFEYVLINEKSINAIWITRNRKIYNQLKDENKPVLMSNSLQGIYTSLRAGVVFINNHPKDLNSRVINGAQQIWLWHGLMMKQIGRDSNTFSRRKNKRIKNYGVYIRKLIFPEYIYNPNYTINTSNFFTPFFCSAFKLKPAQVLLTGYPRNDVLFYKETEPLINELNEKFNNPLKILYLPTWRDALVKGGEIFNPFNNHDFSMADFQKVLNRINGIFINKGHNFEKKKILENPISERFINLKNNQFSDLYLLLKDVDILITDYSSVYFDFLLTGKPVILAPFDYKDYTTQSRPLYYDYFKEIEGIKATNWNELIDILDNKKYFSPSKENINKFHIFQDSNSSKRLVSILKTLSLL